MSLERLAAGRGWPAAGYGLLRRRAAPVPLSRHLPDGRDRLDHVELVGTEDDVHVRRPADQAIVGEGEIDGVALWLVVALYDRA
jgi:hypothetical protein